ncbi:MAG TPA: hypothetical protein GXX20_08020 [Clostridiaceae bacterium]|nr:hypothetical protein [Clostridiaceae bacterium]
MYTTTEVMEDILAQRFDDNGNLVEEVTIPKGTKITIIDMGDCAEIISPDKYKGLMFTDGYEADPDEEN